jgi:dihydrofolate reductase
MRKLLVTSFLTLDGVSQAPGDPAEDESGAFAYGGWSVSYWDDTMNQVMGAIMGKPYDLLLGRRTYDIFASYWPRRADEPGGGQSLNAATKYVVSASHPELPWGPKCPHRGRRPCGDRQNSRRVTVLSCRCMAAAT